MVSEDKEARSEASETKANARPNSLTGPGVSTAASEPGKEGATVAVEEKDGYTSSQQ
jgi:hypothetical protein